jgi:hypothetical protein
MKDIEWVNISFQWHKSEHIISRQSSVWEQCKMGKKVIYWWRQCLIFIHNNTEMKEMWGIFLSHQQGLWVTCEPSRAFPKLWVTSDELFLLIGKYFWMTESFGLGLEAMWPQEPCFKQSASISGRWVEILVLVASLKCRLECRMEWVVIS